MSGKRNGKAPAAHPTLAEDTSYGLSKAGETSARRSDTVSLGKRLKSSASSLAHAAVSAGPDDANAAFAAQLQASEKASASSSTPTSSPSAAAALETARDSSNITSSTGGSDRPGESFRSQASSDEQAVFSKTEPALAYLDSINSGDQGSIQDAQLDILSAPDHSTVKLEQAWAKANPRPDPKSGTLTNTRDDPLQPLNQAYRAVASKYRLSTALGPLLPHEVPGHLSEAMRQTQSAQVGLGILQHEYQAQLNAFDRLNESGKIDLLQVRYPPAEWLDMAVPNYLDFLTRPIAPNGANVRGALLNLVREKWNKAGPGKFQPDWFISESNKSMNAGWRAVQHQYAKQLSLRRQTWETHANYLIQGHESVARSVQMVGRDHTHLSAQDGADVVALLDEPGSLATDEALHDETAEVTEQTVDDLFGPSSKPQDLHAAQLEDSIRSSLPSSAQHGAVSVNNPMNLKPEGYDDDDEGFLASWRDVLKRYTDDVWDPESQPWVTEAREELKKVHGRASEGIQQSPEEDDRRKASIRRLRQVVSHLKVAPTQDPL